MNPKVRPDFRLPLPRPPFQKGGERRWEKNKRRRETRKRVAVTKAKASERERPQITVATVIQKPGIDVNEGVISNMNEKSKEIQVLDVLRKYMPEEKVLAMFDDLMNILRKGGTHSERKKMIVLKREEKAVEDVMIAAEAQKAAEVERLIAAEKAAEEERLKQEGERERIAAEEEKAAEAA